MHQQNIPNGPAFGSDYVPYFYQSGQFLAYNLVDNTAAKGLLERSISNYDFNSYVTGKSFPQGIQTVEDVIQKGYLAVPETEPETALISDRNHVSKMGLSDIICQIKGRYRIYQQNIYQLERSKSDAVNCQFAIEASRGAVAMDSKEAYSLNKRITELYVQQLNERTKLWQDVSKLRQLLPENAQNYLTSYRKLSILQDNEGDIL
mgnify:FL=1